MSRLLDLDLVRIVVGVDPAASSHDKSDETGIVIAARGRDDLGYVLGDYSGKYPPMQWAEKVVEAYRDFKADRVVAEVNKGGDMVEAMLRTIDCTISFKGVHATRNKQTRAEPVAALYEKGRIKHLEAFPALEEQMCQYVPGKSSKSPDRMDALVWALTDLFINAPRKSTVNIWDHSRRYI